MTPALDNLHPIQMLWVRGNLGRMEMLSIRSFLAQGHAVHFYTYEAPANLPGGVIVMDADAVVPRRQAPLEGKEAFAKGSMGSFSDYFRYALLDEMGGWWSDLDVVALQPWIFKEEALTASTKEFNYGEIANGCVMKFSRRHPVIRACLDALRVDQRGLQDLTIADTGPLLLNRIMESRRLKGLCKKPSVFCPVPWNASWQLLRPVWKRFTMEELKQRIRRPHLSMKFTRQTVAVHLWNETWRQAGWDKEAVYDPTCLYERLQKRFNP